MANTQFGRRLALSGDYLAVGAYEEVFGGSKPGAVYIFARVANSWIEQQKLTASDGGARDALGSDVAISGDTVAAFATSSPEFSAAVIHFHRHRTTQTCNRRAAPSSAR